MTQSQPEIPSRKALNSHFPIFSQLTLPLPHPKTCHNSSGRRKDKNPGIFALPTFLWITQCKFWGLGMEARMLRNVLKSSLVMQDSWWSLRDIPTIFQPCRRSNPFPKKKNYPAEEFFTSSTNPQKHLQTIYIPKFLSWLWAVALLIPCYSTWMTQTCGILSQKSSLTGIRKEIPHLWQNTQRWGWAALPSDLGLDSLPLAQFQKVFPKEFLTLFGMGPSFILFFFFFLIKWASSRTFFLKLLVEILIPYIHPKYLAPFCWCKEEYGIFPLGKGEFLVVPSYWTEQRQKLRLLNIPRGNYEAK